MVTIKEQPYPFKSATIGKKIVLLAGKFLPGRGLAHLNSLWHSIGFAPYRTKYGNVFQTLAGMKGVCRLSVL